MERATEELLQSASRGDVVALDALLLRYLPELRAFVRLNLGPHLQVRESFEDVEQSVCREVLSDLDRFEYRGDEAFKKWLFLCALRKIRDRHRYHGRARRDPTRERAVLDEAMLSGYATLTTPSAVAIQREEIERLHRAFDRLSPDYRSVITMSRLLGMSHAEVGRELGRSEGAVAVLLHRALAKLGLLLAD